MKKRLIALISATALLLAIAPVALAATGLGEVRFTFDPNMINGLNPGPGPQGVNNYHVSGLNFDFGDRLVSFTREFYEAPVLTAPLPGGVEQAQGAHFQVISMGNWNVSLALSGFVNTSAGNAPTMPLSYIVLNPDTTVHSVPGDTTSPVLINALHSWGPVPSQAGAFGTASFSNQNAMLVPGGNATTPGTAIQFVGGNAGIWNASVPATLVVAPSDALYEGTMRAVLTWTLVVT